MEGMKMSTDTPCIDWLSENELVELNEQELMH